MNEHSFALLSTMSPKIRKKYTNNVYQKMPTKLALKKNIRRSSIFDTLPPTAHNNSVILVEATTTDASNTNSSHSRLSIINSTHITISDSESSDSKSAISNIENKVDKIQYDYGLSESKYNAIDKWISNLDQTSPEPLITSKDKLDSYNNLPTFIRKEKKETVGIKVTSNAKEANSFMIVKNQNLYNKNTASPILTLMSKSKNSVSSSSDIIEDSDDNPVSENSLKTSLLGDLQEMEWKKPTNILLTKSEPRYKKKNRNPFTTVPNTKNTKARFTIVHKNPYLDFNQKSQKTPIMQPKPYVETPWSKRLQALCDTDSSDNSFTNGILENDKNPLAVRLFPVNKTDGNENCFDSKVGQLGNGFEKIFKDITKKFQNNEISPSIDSEKENLSDFSIDSETLEDKLRKKLSYNKKVKQKTNTEKTSEKDYNHLSLNKKDYDKNLSKHLHEYFSDSSNDSYSLEDKLKRKLKLPKSKDILKRTLDVKCNTNFKEGITSNTEVPNIKLIKKTNVYVKKKNTIKSKTVQKKAFESSEGGGSNNKLSSHNIKSSNNLGEEYLSDSSVTSEKFTSKAGVELKRTVNGNICTEVTSKNGVPSYTDLDNIKLNKKCNINTKKKNTTKAKTVKKKASEDGSSNTKLSSHNIKSSTNLEKEYLSDSSISETLEDQLERKLRLNDEVKPSDNFKTKSRDTLNCILHDNIFTKDLDNIKLNKKGNIYTKKKNTIKAKTVKKKPISSSEDSDLDIKEINQKSIASNDSERNPTNVKSFLASLTGSVPLSQCDHSARIFRKNFKLYKHELVTKLFNLYNEKIFNNAIPSDTLIEWSERMRGTAGFCYCKKITHTTGVIDRQARIVLASKVLDCPDRLRDTLIHEMCHAATWIVNEVSDGHGNYWKAWVRKARATFPELPPINVCHNYAISTKFTYRCVKCGYSFGRHTRSIDVERNRCGRCYGLFEILINKTTKSGETIQVPATPKKQPTGFALFVKENYTIYKSPQLNHGQVMKVLGQKYAELKVSICIEDKEKT